MAICVQSVMNLAPDSFLCNEIGSVVFDAVLPNTRQPQ